MRVVLAALVLALSMVWCADQASPLIRQRYVKTLIMIDLQSEPMP